MQKINFNYFEIEYSNKDTPYINLIIEEFKNKYPSIMGFFNLKKFERKITIKFWNSLEEYRTFFNEKMKKYNKKVEKWEVGRSTNNSNECRIDLLCLEERKKCQGHQNDNIIDLTNVLIHEFVHTCHFTYNKNKDTMTWFAEALATNLANQYNYLSLNCSLADILNGHAHYLNYYSMGRYLIDNNDKDYILKLAKNKKLLEEDTPNIYNKTLAYIKEINKPKHKH